MLCLVNDKNEGSLFSRAFADQQYALNLYKNEHDKFHTLSLYERARLARQHMALIESMIANPRVAEEDIKAITMTFPDNDEFALKFRSAIIRNSPEQMTKIATLLNSASPIFQKLNDFNKVEMALHNPNIIIEMIKDGSILKLNDTAFSRMAASLALTKNINFCLEFARNSTLFAKLQPAARELVLSRLKQSDDIVLDNLPNKVIKLIKNAYNLPMDNEKQFLLWIPCLAGVNDADFYGRFYEVLHCALGTYWINQPYTVLNRTPTANERINQEALALILVRDKRFIEGNKTISGYVCALLNTEDRLKLGELYPQIALELLRNPTTQGKRFFSSEECERLITAHPGRNDISAAAIYCAHWKEVKEKLVENPDTVISAEEICHLYEQYSNIEHSIPFAKEKPSLKNLAAHAFFTSKNNARLPAELQELVHDIEEFSQANFGSQLGQG